MLPYVGLIKCGFIFLEIDSRTRGIVFYKATLAPLAFNVMRQASPLDAKESLGQSFRRVVSEKSWQALRTIVNATLSAASSAIISSGN